MIALLHGYHLDGSGSCIYVQCVTRELARMGQDVLLLCQEPEIEKYPFIGQAFSVSAKGELKEFFSRPGSTPGKVIYIRPHLPNHLLPVFVPGKFPGFQNIKAYSELTEHELEAFVQAGVTALQVAGRRFQIETIFAHHLVMMPTIAQRAQVAPVHAMAHGSEIEYLLKSDERYRRLAGEAVKHCQTVISGSQEMVERMNGLFEMGDRHRLVPIGVDAEFFSQPLGAPRSENVNQLKRTIAEELTGETDSPTRPDKEFLAQIEAFDWEQDQIITNVGKIISGKGVQDLLAAAPAIIAENPHARIVVAGEGKYKPVLLKFLAALAEGRNELPGNEAHLRFVRSYLTPDVLSQAKRTRWRGRVHFAGYLRHASQRYLLALSQVGVYPSIIKESGPLTLLEGMAAGAFPIATDDGGVRDRLFHLKGLLHPDEEALTRIPLDSEYRIKTLVKHVLGALKVARSELGPRMSAHVAQNCSWRSVCSELSKILRR